MLLKHMKQTSDDRRVIVSKHHLDGGIVHLGWRPLFERNNGMHDDLSHKHFDDEKGPFKAAAQPIRGHRLRWCRFFTSCGRVLLEIAGPNGAG
jgi:hypothetical protein